MDIPKAVYLYNEGVKGVDFKGLAGFIKKTFENIPVKVISCRCIVVTKGLVLDLKKTKEIFDKVIHNRRAPLKVPYDCHIILTDKIFATYDEDKRLHIRASIYSYPSIVSTSGIVEGPAKPREYYLYKEQFMRLKTWELEEPKIKRRFAGRFIDYGDKRITSVLKGYISQAIFFYATGEPFCPKRSCRLFNSHWQEDLIYSQIKSGRFCPSHKKVLDKLNG